MKGFSMAEQVVETVADKGQMQSAAAKTELAVYKGEVFPMKIPKEWSEGGCDGEFMTTVNRDRPEGWHIVMQSLNGAVQKLDTVLNLPIVSAAFTIHPAYKLDAETGLRVQFVRTILHCVDGKSYEAFSDGVLKSLRIRFSMLGKEMFSPPAKCIPRRISTSDARSMYRLDWQD